MKNLTLLLCASLAAVSMARADDDTNTPSASATTNAAIAVTPAATSASDATASLELSGTNGLVLNFHEAPLGTVLDYLSEKAGYIVFADDDMRQKVTLESATPISRDELRDVLNTVLIKNGYRVTIDGRKLTIKRTGDAVNSSDTPIANTSDPDKIPITDTITTQILPVHSLDPQQLIKDLDQLVPTGAKVSANEAGNAVIMTAPSRDIHHFAEIIKALDGSAVSSVAVFMLKYGDAKSVASELKEVFQSADSNVTRANRIGQGGGRTRFNPFGGGGGGGFGGMFGGGGGGGGGGTENGQNNNPNTQAVFTSDDQMNAVVAAAPPELMPAITNVITELDQPVQDITVVRVFHLHHADPNEMADELTSLFSTSSGTDQNSRSAGFQFFRGGGFPGFGGGGGGGGGNSQSDRMKRQSQVTAVADPRTASVIVTSSRALMNEIEGMIADLDKSDAHAQVVTTFDISNADPSDIQSSMQALFASQNSRNQSSTQNQSPLVTRAQQAANQQTSSAATTFGTSGSGGGGGTGR